jgi:hypothetical protein
MLLIDMTHQRKTTANKTMEKLNKQETKMSTKRTITSHLNSPITKAPRHTMLEKTSPDGIQSINCISTALP